MRTLNFNHRIPKTSFTKHQDHLEEMLITAETLGLPDKKG